MRNIIYSEQRNLGSSVIRILDTMRVNEWSNNLKRKKESLITDNTELIHIFPIVNSFARKELPALVEGKDTRKKERKEEENTTTFHISCEVQVTLSLRPQNKDMEIAMILMTKTRASICNKQLALIVYRNTQSRFHCLPLLSK